MVKNLHKKDFDIWMNPTYSIKLKLKPLHPPPPLPPPSVINAEKLHALSFEKMQ